MFSNIGKQKYTFYGVLIAGLLTGHWIRENSGLGADRIDLAQILAILCVYFAPIFSFIALSDKLLEKWADFRK